MGENTIKVLKELLNKEKWTRATLSSYGINNLKELDDIIAELDSEEVKKEVKQICNEHLVHSKNSIIALYISGVISLTQHIIDDSNLIILVNIFSDNHKWNIVEFLCERILEFGENKYALRTLADVYANKNEEEKKYKIWERLIKVDYEEAEIVKLLAQKKEAEGDIQEATSYYKKALYRYINKNMFSNVREIWMKLVEYKPEDVDFYLQIDKKISKALSTEKSSSLLYTLIPYFKSKENWDIMIKIIKIILKYEPKNYNARKDIIAAYREKYKTHSQLEDYIKISNLSQTWRNVHDALQDFEKHISFDKGNYVFHRSWGIGRISNITNDVFVIDFPGKESHKMSLKMAVSALKNLGNEHIWVLKAIMDKAELRKKVMEDIPWALRIIIKSFDNVASIKKIKAELTPDVLSNNDWTNWSSEARKILKTDPYFGTLADKIDEFEVRESPISFEEKTFNKFKAEKNFFQRLKTLQDFVKHAEPDSDYFGEMFGYFIGFCKNFSSVNELVLSSYLLVQSIVSNYAYLNPGLDYTFADLFSRIEDPSALFTKIEDSDLKRYFLLQIKRYIPEWPHIYIKLFTLHQSKFIIDELAANKELSTIEELVKSSIEHYKEYRESFVWLVTNTIDEPWFISLDIKFEKILISMIHILGISYREIENRRDVNVNRKLNKQIFDFLFKNDRLITYVAQAEEDSIVRIYTLLDDIRELDPAIKINVRHKIKEIHPHFKFIGDGEKEIVKRKVLVTKKAYADKQTEIKHILEVDVPNNSKEIGEAMQKGDLRENAEYKAALEKQDLLNSTCLRLQEEVRNAQIFDESQIDTSAVTFGTRVKVTNLKTNTNEEYVILGPWESNPAKNVISYLSPLGAGLYNHKVSEDIQFTINENEFHYRIEAIERAI